MSHKIVIIGAGPCGLGAAKRLAELRYDNWLLFDRESYAGGLAASFVDNKGFTWDVGGHVVFSHYREFDKMLEETCGGELLYHQRKSLVRVDNSWVPYPFQNNLGHLPPDKAVEVLTGLRLAPGGNSSQPFSKWMEDTFGEGIVRLFMRPYNSKLWATDLSLMASEWIAERVSIVDFNQVLKSVILGQGDDSWGPNRTFAFPLRGGTGEIFRRLAASLPQSKLFYDSDVIRLDLENRTIRLNSGSSIQYDYLINTMPLTELLSRSDNVPDSIRKFAERLRHSGTYVVGCGFKTPLDDDRCWMYFPEQNVPFYRVTNFARYSPFNVPKGRTDRYCAYMCETSFSDTKPEEQTQVTQATWQGLYNVGLVPKAAEGISEYVIKVPYAYPVPTLDRNDALRVVQPYLMKHGVYSRGRFGAWMYEIGNMDHSYKQGIDVVDHILDKKEEIVWQMK